MKNINESVFNKVKKKSRISDEEIPFSAIGFIDSLRKYIEHQNIITDKKGIIVDEEYNEPYCIVCEWRNTTDENQLQCNQSETNLRLDLIVYRFSYFHNRCNKPDVVDLSFAVNCPLKIKGWSEDKISVHVAVNMKKSDYTFNNQQYKRVYGTDFELDLNGNYVDPYEYWDNNDFGAIRRFVLNNCALDANITNLNYAKSIVDNIKSFIEKKTFSGLFDKSVRDVNYNEMVEKILGVKVPYKSELNESVFKKVKKISKTDIEDDIDQEIFNKKLTGREFIKGLHEFILSYKVDWRQTNGKRFQPYRMFDYEWAQLRVWPNEFAVRNYRDFELNLCFDVSNSKKSYQRICFTCQYQGDSNKLDEYGKVICYFELGMPPHNDVCYEYTISPSKRYKLVDTKTGYRLKEKQENLFTDSMTFDVIKNDLKYFLEHWKDLYTSYLKNDWSVAWKNFYKSLPSVSGKTVNESVFNKVKNSGSKSIEDRIDNEIMKVDINQFNQIMNGFVPDIKKKYKNVFFTKPTFQLSSKKNNNISYRVVKSVVCKFPKRIVGEYMNVDRTRILFDVNMYQYGISYYDKKEYEDLNTPVGIFTVDFFMRLGQSNKPQQFMFSSLELNDDDFVIGEMREKREWEKPNMCYSLAVNYKRFVDALAKTIYDMPKNIWSEIGEVSSTFTPFPGECCCKVDGDKIIKILEDNGFYDKLHYYYKNNLNESVFNKVKKIKKDNIEKEAETSAFGYDFIVKRYIKQFGTKQLVKEFLTCPVIDSKGVYAQNTVYFKEFKSEVTNKIHYLSLGELELVDDKVYCCWRRYTTGSPYHLLANKMNFSEMTESDQKGIVEYLEKRFGNLSESVFNKVKKSNSKDLENDVDKLATDCQSLCAEFIKEEGIVVNWGGEQQYVVNTKYAKDSKVPSSAVKANLRNCFIISKNDVSYLIVTWIVKPVDNNDIKLYAERFTKKGYQFNSSREEYDWSELSTEQQNEFYNFISDKKHIVTKKENKLFI